MGHRIPTVTPAAPAQPVAMSPRDRAAEWIALVTKASAARPGHPTGGNPPAPLSAPTPRSGPVRSGDFGRDGRFEKFILALQALRLDLGGAASRTDRVERMRAAAEELFSIDGLPQPVPPMALPAAASGNAAAPEADAERLAPEAALVALTDLSSAMPETKPGTPPAEAPRASASPAASAEPAAPPTRVAAIPLPGGREREH